MNLHVLPMFVWTLYQYSRVLLESKDMYGVRLSGDFKLVNMNSCLCVLLALRLVGSLSMMYSTSHHVGAGIGSSPL